MDGFCNLEEIKFALFYCCMGVKFMKGREGERYNFTIGTGLTQVTSLLVLPVQ